MSWTSRHDDALTTRLSIHDGPHKNTAPVHCTTERWTPWSTANRSASPAMLLPSALACPPTVMAGVGCARPGSAGSRVALQVLATRACSPPWSPLISSGCDRRTANSEGRKLLSDWRLRHLARQPRMASACGRARWRQEVLPDRSARRSALGGLAVPPAGGGPLWLPDLAETAGAAGTSGGPEHPAYR